MIIYVKGNLLKSDCDVIAHGCNCFCTMGSGIARQIRQKYPGAYQADLETINGDLKKLGAFSLFKSEDFDIYNLYTQYKYGSDKVHLVYAALELSLITMKYHLQWEYENYSELKIGFPKIGCGLAGGDWEKVSKIIENVFSDIDVYVYEI